MTRRIPRSPPHSALMALLPLIICASPPGVVAQEMLPLREWVEGTLEEGDSVNVEGFAYDAFRIPGGLEGVISLRAESAAFDTYLEWGVRGGGEFLIVAQNNNFQELAAATDSRIFARVGPGEYPELRISALEGDAWGEYRIRLDLIEAAAVAVPEPLPYGSDVTASLTETDAFVAGTFLDAYQLTGAAEDRVQLVLESAWFDAFLRVYDPDGALLAEDDDGMGGTDAYLEVTLPATGEYRVEVASFEPGLGKYRLRAGPDLGVEPAPVTAPEFVITEEERAQIIYDDAGVRHDVLGFSFPTPGADFLPMEDEEVMAVAGEMSDNVHIWGFQSVLETAQLRVMIIKAEPPIGVEVLESLRSLVMENANATVLEESTEWEVSRSVSSRYRVEQEEAELRCMASPPGRPVDLIVCLIGASVDGRSFRDLLMALEAR